MTVRLKSLPPSVQIGIINLRSLSSIGTGSAQVDELITDAEYSIQFLLNTCSLDKTLKITKHEKKKLEKIPFSGEFSKKAT